MYRILFLCLLLGFLTSLATSLFPNLTKAIRPAWYKGTKAWIGTVIIGCIVFGSLLAFSLQDTGTDELFIPFEKRDTISTY